MTKLAFLLVYIPAVAFADKSFTGDKAGTWDCAQDPEVSLTTSDATFTLKGACTSISVTGDNIKLTIESIKDLVLNGNKNTATVGKLGELTVNGNSNKVTWKAALSGKKPAVQNNGKSNGVAKAK